MQRPRDSHATPFAPIFDGVRPLPIGLLLLAYVAHLALSIFANFWLFRSGTFAFIGRVTHGLIDGTLLANMLLIAAFIALLGIIGGARRAEFGLYRPHLIRSAIIILAVWISLNLFAAAVAAVDGDGIHLASTFRTPDQAFSAIGALLGQLFGNALYEEIAFRGVLLTQLALFFGRTRPHAPGGRTVLLAILISQALFALQHIPNRLAFGAWSTREGALLDLLMLFISGVFFALVFLRTRGLLIAVGLHALINTPTALIACPEWAPLTALAIAMFLMIGLGPRATAEFSRIRRINPAATSPCKPPASQSPAS